MPGADQNWVPLATVFPVGLDTQTEPTRLKDGFSPDAYGMDPDAKGRLKRVATIPVGQAKVAKTYTIGANTWTWYFRRNWRANSTALEYLAPLYRETALYQDIGILSFDEDAEALVTFLPMGGNDLYVGKATGGYVVQGAASFGGNFQHGNIVPSMKVSAAANAVSMDGAVYVSNAFGLMGWAGGDVKELTMPVRDIVSNFQNVALTQDPQRGWIVGTGVFVYDTVTKKLFRFDSTNFRYTTRVLTEAADGAFSVTRIGLSFDNTTGGENEQIDVEIKRDRGTWQSMSAATVIRNIEGERVWKEIILDDAIQSYKFQVRIVNMAASIEVRSIWVQTDSTLQPGWPE